MGECGCAIDTDVARIKCGQGWLILGLYPGCEECCHTVEMEFKFVLKLNADGWDYSVLPDWTDKVKDQDGFKFPIVSLRQLVREFRQEAADPSDYDDGGDYISDSFFNIRSAVQETYREFIKTGKVED